MITSPKVQKDSKRNTEEAPLQLYNGLYSRIELSYTKLFNSDDSLYKEDNINLIYKNKKKNFVSAKISSNLPIQQKLSEI